MARGAEERHTAAFVVGIALGGLAGAGYVLLKTPRSGNDVRAEIAARVQGIVEAVKETAGVVGVETRRAGEQTVERIEATGAAVRERLPGASGVSDLVPGPNRETPAADPVAALHPPEPTPPVEAAARPAADPPVPPQAGITLAADPGLGRNGAADAGPPHDDPQDPTVSRPAADEPARTGG